MTDNSNLKVMLDLLEDEDQSVWSPVQQELINRSGPTTLSFLEEAWKDSADPVVADRIEEIIHTINSKDLADSFKAWWTNEHTDLKQGLVLLNKINTPSFCLEELELIIKPILSEIWLELNDHLTALEKVRVINHLLFTKHGLQALSSITSKAAHFFIPNLMRMNRGHHLAIAQLYCLLARELEIPIYKVGSSSISALSFVDTKGLPKEAGINFKESKSLFYIVTDEAGEVFGERQFSSFIEHEFPTQGKNLQILSDKSFIKNILGYLKHCFSEESNKKQLQTLTLVLAQLS